MHLVTDRPLKPKRRKSLVGQFVLAVASCYLIFCVAFTLIEIPTCTLDNLIAWGQTKIHTLLSVCSVEVVTFIKKYCPQLLVEQAAYKLSSYCGLAPLSIVLGYVLGARMAVAAFIMFLILGTFGPWINFYPFANGGGLKYYTEPTFGYLVGLVLAAYLSGKITRERRTSLTQVTAVVLGCAAVHLSGVIYLFGAYLTVYLTEGSKNFFEWQPWIFQYVRNLTWYSLPYDLIFSLMLVGLAFPLRLFVDTMTIRNNHARSRKPTDRKSTRLNSSH